MTRRMRPCRQSLPVIAYCCDRVGPRRRLSSTTTCPVMVAADDHLTPLRLSSTATFLVMVAADDHLPLLTHRFSPPMITCHCSPIGLHRRLSSTATCLVMVAADDHLPLHTSRRLSSTATCPVMVAADDPLVASHLSVLTASYHPPPLAR